MQKSVFTIKELAQKYHFPEYGIRGLVKRNAFPVIMCGTRCYITRKTFEDFISTGGELYSAQKSA